MSPVFSAACTSAPRQEPMSASCASIGRLATLALYDELELSPKPGLVTLVDSGSHSDMDGRTFMRSLLALRDYFPDIARLGAQGAPFEDLQRCGLVAERQMFHATGGINTHRGAVFMMGLLCASAGAVRAEEGSWTPHTLRKTLRSRWGEALSQRAAVPSKLPGGIAARKYGLRSASEEAAAGFPALFEVAIPALVDALRRGLPWDLARLDTLFHLMAVLEDSNLAHRGGLEGLHFAQACARTFLAEGGAAQSGAVAAAQRVGVEFVRRRLSPGGAADTLAAACWVHRLTAGSGRGTNVDAL